MLKYLGSPKDNFTYHINIIAIFAKKPHNLWQKVGLNIDMIILKLSLFL